MATRIWLDKWLLSVVILILLTTFLDRAIPEGLFFDGLTYSSIARNLAQGEGSFWHLVYMYEFYEHPPLALALQAVFFQILGDSFYTEKIFCLFNYIITLLLLGKLWQKVYGSFELFWIVLLFWGFSPVVLWSYANNLLDNTMAIFDLLAVIFLYHAFQNSSVWDYLLAFFAYFCIILAIGSKGPVGMFPLAIPSIYYLTYRKSTLKVVIIQIILILGVVSTLYFIYQLPDSQQFIQKYWQQQVQASIQGQRDVTASPWGRFVLIEELLVQLLPGLAITFFVVIANWFFNKKWIQLQNNSTFAFFLLVGCSASLPMLISLKIRWFYLIPAIPYLTIAFAYLVAPVVRYWLNKANLNLWKTRLYFTYAIAIIGCSGYLLSKIGTTGRDHILTADLKKIQPFIPQKADVFICQAMHQDWTMIAYFQRYLRTKFTDELHNTTYALLNTDLCSEDELLKNNFLRITTHTVQYHLYKKQNNTKTQ